MERNGDVGGYCFGDVGGDVGGKCDEDVGGAVLESICVNDNDNDNDNLFLCAVTLPSGWRRRQPVEKMEKALLIQRLSSVSSHLTL